MKHINKKYLVLPIALLLTQPAWSIDGELDTIVVTATRSEQTSTITPTNIKTISRNEIEASGANNITDILRGQAGIQISDAIGDGSRATISMRGFGANASNNTLIMIDGRKLNNPSIEAAVLTAIAVSDIERIEIMEGSGGVLYGDQAVGGVINIITRQPIHDPYYHVETSLGSHDLKTYRASASQKFSNGFAYRLSSEDKTTDNYRDNNEANYSNYFGRAEQNSDAGQVFIEAQRIDDDLNLPGSLSQADENNDRKQTFTPADFSNYVTDMYRLGGAAKLSDNWDFLAELTDRDADLNGHITFFGTSTFEQDTHVRTLSPRLVGRLDTKHGTTHITAGYDLQKSDYQYASTNIFAAPKDASQDIEGLYAQIIYPFLDRWTVTTGIRESSVDDDDKLSGADNDDSETTTEIGVNWAVMNNLRVFMRRAENIRFANADENALTLPGVIFLNPQTGVSKEAGLEFINKRWNAKATFFDMDIDDEIYFDAFAFANINLPNSNRKGVLLDNTYDLTADVTLGASYTYTDTEITEGSFQGNKVPFVAENMGSASVLWKFAPNLSVYSDAIYTGSRYKTDDDANIGSQTSNFWIYNLALRWDWRQVNASLRVNNMTGEQYAGLESFYDYQYTAPEETIELTLGYTFK